MTSNKNLQYMREELQSMNQELQFLDKKLQSIDTTALYMTERLKHFDNIIEKKRNDLIQEENNLFNKKIKITQLEYDLHKIREEIAKNNVKNLQLENELSKYTSGKK